MIVLQTAQIKDVEKMNEIMMFIPCHRIPERCLHIKGKPMPLCTRCFAILLGYMFVPVAVLVPLVVPLWLPFLMAVPLLMDGFTQRWKWRTSTNTLRFFTGLLFGIGQAIFISTVVWSIASWVVS